MPEQQDAIRIITKIVDDAIREVSQYNPEDLTYVVDDVVVACDAIWAKNYGDSISSDMENFVQAYNNLQYSLSKFRSELP